MLSTDRKSFQKFECTDWRIKGQASQCSQWVRYSYVTCYRLLIDRHVMRAETISTQSFAQVTMTVYNILKLNVFFTTGFLVHCTEFFFCFCLRASLQAKLFGPFEITPFRLQDSVQNISFPSCRTHVSKEDKKSREKRDAQKKKV